MSAATDPVLIMRDCWNSIGITGDQSCEKLTAHIHCRNCEVYSAAAQRNLQRPVDDAYRADWAAELRKPHVASAPTDASALVFRIGAEWLALPTAMVVQVAPVVPAHRLPHRGGGALLGVVNIAGKLTPSVSLAALLGIDERAAVAPRGRQTFARLLMVESGGRQFALPVAELHDIVRYQRAALDTPAATINQALHRYLGGVLAHGRLRIGVLDPALLGEQLARQLQ
ncbi:MAG: chemotaxis protein CheW [Massilia sp.]